MWSTCHRVVVTLVFGGLAAWLALSAPVAVAMGRLIAGRSVYDVDEVRRSLSKSS